MWMLIPLQHAWVTSWTKVGMCRSSDAEALAPVWSPKDEPVLPQRIGAKSPKGRSKLS